MFGPDQIVDTEPYTPLSGYTLFPTRRIAMDLVVGATGLVGSEVCLRLLKRGRPVRALVRTTSDPAKVAALRSAGAETILADLKDPASLIEACRGVDTIISTASSTLSRQQGDSIESVDHLGQLNLIQAAKKANVERFIFVSFCVPTGLRFPLGDAKTSVEQALATLNYTILRASWFMEVWLSPALGFDYSNTTATVYGDGKNPISWVSYVDVAEMCVLASKHPATERKAIDFGGPAAVSPLEIITKFQQIGGKTFNVQH